MKLAQILSAFCLLVSMSAVSASLDQDWVRAISKRDVPAIERLLKHGVDVNLSATDGKTALMLAAQQGRLDLIRTLLDAGATVDITNTRGGTALMYAAVLGDTAPIKLLLARGSAVNTQSSTGWTALMIAAVMGHDALVRLLLDQGANAGLADIYGWTPLMRATYEKRLHVVRMLLTSKSVNVNARNDNGATALHYAALRNQFEIAQLLIANGADLLAKDRQERTPLMVARATGHDKLVKLFDRALDKEALQ